MKRQRHYSRTVGVRLSESDMDKLHELAAAMQRPPGDVLRNLIRDATPTYLPQVQFMGPSESGRGATLGED